MLTPQTYTLERATNVKDDIGGTVKQWQPAGSVLGYLDMLDGSKNNAVQSALVESSSHVLVTVGTPSGIDAGMRIVAKGKMYLITFVDDPNNIGHHLEVYCRYDGKVGGED